MKAFKISSLVVGVYLAVVSSAFAEGPAGVCDRAADDGKSKIEADVKLWIDAINSTDMPKEVKDAHNVLFEYNKKKSIDYIAEQKNVCTAQYKPYQDMMDIIVAYYTLGLSEVLKPHMTHVDVSELLNGYPLGGPNALVPKFREQILNGDNGTVANILRDPFKCLTFQRKC